MHPHPQQDRRLSIVASVPSLVDVLWVRQDRLGLQYLEYLDRTVTCWLCADYGIDDPNQSPRSTQPTFA